MKLENVRTVITIESSDPGVNKTLLNLIQNNPKDCFGRGYKESLVECQSCTILAGIEGRKEQICVFCKELTETGEIGIGLRRIEEPEVSKPESTPSSEHREEVSQLDKRLNYFKDESAKVLFQSVLDELMSKGVKVKFIADNWMSFFFKNRSFMTSCPRKTFFVVDTLGPEGKWIRNRKVSNRNEWDSIFAEISKYLE